MREVVVCMRDVQVRKADVFHRACNTRNAYILLAPNIRLVCCIVRRFRQKPPRRIKTIESEVR